MIQVKPIYGDWNYVTKEQAKEYVEFLLSNITCGSIKKGDDYTTANLKLIDYINKNKIRGITVEELLNEK